MVSWSHLREEFQGPVAMAAGVLGTSTQRSCRAKCSWAKKSGGDRKTAPPRSLVRGSGRNNEMHLLRVLFLGPSVPWDALTVAMRRVSSVQNGTKVFQNFQDRRSKNVHYPGYTGRESGR